MGTPVGLIPQVRARIPGETCPRPPAFLITPLLPEELEFMVQPLWFLWPVWPSPQPLLHGAGVTTQGHRAEFGPRGPLLPPLLTGKGAGGQ